MKKSKDFQFYFIAILALVITFISCKDYEDDISNLRTEITELRQKIDDINSALKDGASIKSVEPTTDGIIITLTNNDTYIITNGTPGADGTSGKDGSVVNIGTNGNWYIDGVDTGKPSKGEDGVLGGYYYPNEDGYWYKVEKDVEEKTTQAWLPSGTITATLINGIVTLHNVEGANGPITLGQAILSYLTIIPDFVSQNDGAIVNFSTFTTSCGEIAPSTRVRYLVSPSNASVDLIDVSSLYFKYNNPTVLESRSSEIDPKASFVSLENGVLTVEVMINTEKLEMESSNKIDKIMLVAPLRSGGEVNSDWAKVVSTPLNHEDLALVYNPKNYEGAVWSSMELTKTLDETKDVVKSDPRVLNLKYSETIELKEVVKTMFTDGDWSDFNIDTYNMEIAFDFNDEEGNVIMNKSEEGVDQQQYIKLEGSTVTGLVYEIEGITPSVVDRNPIIHVTLKPKESDLSCSVLEGFIKVNLVESDVVEIPPVLFSMDSIVADCGVHIFRIDSEQMNEKIYTKAQLSKEVFHNIYSWTESSEGVGSIAEIEDLDDADSFNLVWTLTEDEIWNHIGESITKKGNYTFGSNVVEVTFTSNIVQPIADLSGLLLEDMWFKNSYIELDVSIPEINLNSAFKSTSEKLLDLEAAGSKYANYSYEYIFDIDQPLVSDNNITITVSSDGKSLLANDEVVVSIAPQSSGIGDIIIFNNDSEQAISLLNKESGYFKVAIKLLVSNECDKPIMVEAFNDSDTFLVHFLTAEESGTVYVVPGGTGSGKSWDDALGDIQTAIDKATGGSAVWVKGGNYSITSPIINKSAVDLYGGFAGDETSTEDRRLVTDGKSWDFINPTVLDANNQSQIMQSTSAINSKTIVDGFTFINGNGVGSIEKTNGGAIYIDSEFAIYQRCIIRDNATEDDGGGITMTSGTLLNSLIENNSADNGGGILLNGPVGTTTIVEGSTLKSNLSKARGGAFNSIGQGKTFVLQSRIYNNDSNDRASAFQNTNTNFEIANSLIYNNGRLTGSQAYLMLGGGSIYNCTLTNNVNQIYHSGGGTSTNSFYYANNIIWGNTKDISGGVGNRNISFYNNIVQNEIGLLQERYGVVEDNIQTYDYTDLEFIGHPSFQGTALTPEQMLELDNADLSLKTTSFCVDAGKTIEHITHDIDGTLRPQGPAYDIGAYETTK